MEHIYTIKVKKQFDSRGLYPSERRYSASTVFGLAWMHLALAAVSSLLACLFLIKSSSESEMHRQKYNAFHSMTLNVTGNSSLPTNSEVPMELVFYPILVAIGALVTGTMAFLASKRWYVDHYITWFFVSSALTTVVTLTTLCMTASWMVSVSQNSHNFCDYFSDGNLHEKVQLVPEYDANLDSSNVTNSSTWFYVIKVPIEELKSRNIPLLGEAPKESKTLKVLTVNFLIAAGLELFWSLYSAKIALQGMRSDYPEEDSRRGPTVRVVTEIKGNNTKHLPKNTKILPPQPDLIEHYPKNDKIKKFFESQKDSGGYFLRTNQKENDLLVLGGKDAAECPRRESGAEYRERILTFLNGCDSEAGQPSNPDRSLDSSWGDKPDYTIYDQNTLDLDKIRLNIEKRRYAENSHAEPSSDSNPQIEAETLDVEEDKEAPHNSTKEQIN